MRQTHGWEPLGEDKADREPKCGPGVAADQGPEPRQGTSTFFRLSYHQHSVNEVHTA